MESFWANVLTGDAPDVSSEDLFTDYKIGWNVDQNVNGGRSIDYVDDPKPNRIYPDRWEPVDDFVFFFRATTYWDKSTNMESPIIIGDGSIIRQRWSDMTPDVGYGRLSRTQLVLDAKRTPPWVVGGSFL